MFAGKFRTLWLFVINLLYLIIAGKRSIINYKIN